ncbi:MAG: ABC-type polysaccharide/polyol phosphate transport system ATPase subunit [Bacteroidia bacterium]|jgi:ABC-type polysaccharide/polyol phosphate transport system ATPase subunit
MTTNLAIVVEGLSKTFIQNDGIEFEALKNVSFEVNKGEVLGVIGANGSGKSTLLNILSEIIPPTAGKAKINGDCSSILDVGSGFHPDLTGRENVYFKGRLLGMSTKEIDDRFEELVSFSELGNFINQPLKSYSNGMFLRLAFSLSITLAYDIILLDEVLAVGDLGFQLKCKKRISAEVEKGKTVILVSHSLDEVKHLTHRCILLEKGTKIGEGSTENMIELYRERYEMQAKDQLIEDSGDVEILSCVINGLETKEEVTELFRNQAFEIVVKLRKNSDSPLELMLTLLNNVDVMVLSDSMIFREDYKASVISRGEYTFRVTVPGSLLNKDSYRVVCMCSSDLQVIFPSQVIGKFKLKAEVWEEGLSWSDQMAVTRPMLDWRLNKIG